MGDTAIGAAQIPRRVTVLAHRTQQRPVFPASISRHHQVLRAVRLGGWRTRSPGPPPRRGRQLSSPSRRGTREDVRSTSADEGSLARVIGRRGAARSAGVGQCSRNGPVGLWPGRGRSLYEEAVSARAVPEVTIGELCSLLGDWSAGSRPLYLSLADGLEGLILRGDVAPGTRLPAERSLASSLSVSRGTVMSTYERLRSRHFVASRQGSGTIVKLDAPRPMLPDIDAVGPSAPSRALSARFFDQNTEVIDLAVALLHDTEPLTDAFLPTTWRELSDVTGGHGYTPQGLHTLRAEICSYYQDRGLRTDPDQVLMTAGAQQAIDLCRGAGLAARRQRPGGKPDLPRSDRRVRPAGRTYRQHPLRQPLGPSGSAPEAIEAHAPRLVYLMPGTHNPTGRSLPDTRRREIARLADQHELYVIEDNTLADMNFAPATVPSRGLRHGRPGPDPRLAEQVRVGRSAYRLDTGGGFTDLGVGPQTRPRKTSAAARSPSCSRSGC